MSWPDAPRGDNPFTPDVTTDVYGFTAPYKGSLVGISGMAGVVPYPNEDGGTFTIHVFVNGVHRHPCVRKRGAPCAVCELCYVA